MAQTHGSHSKTSAAHGGAKDGHGHGEPWHWLGDGSLRGEDPDEGLGHIVELSTVNKVFGSLLVLTVVTVGASRIDFGVMNTVIAIVIASIKALLVALFFMHLKFEKKVILLYAIYPLVLLFLLVGSTVMDVADREHVLPVWAEKLESKARPAPEAHGAEGAAHGSHEASGTAQHQAH